MYNLRKIRIDTDTIVTCLLKKDGTYDVLSSQGKKLFTSAPAALVEFFAAQEAALMIRELTDEQLKQLRAAALALGVPYMMATGGGTYENLILDAPSLTVQINIEEFGLDNASLWFREHGRPITGKEPFIEYVTRLSECGSRDKYWQPWIRFYFIPGKSYPFPVYDAGTVGKGVKFPYPILRREEDGWVTCTYQEFLAGLIKAGWQFVPYDGAKNEKEYARRTRSYGSPVPLFE